MTSADTSDQPVEQRATTPEGRFRDHTGAPLPFDAPDPPRGYAMEHDPATVEEALALGVELWNRGRYFEAHEVLEHVWHAAPRDDVPAPDLAPGEPAVARRDDGGSERRFWQGVIQVAVAHVLGQRGRPEGIPRTAQKARAKFVGIPDQHHGIDLAALLAQLDEAERRATAGEPPLEPSFPATEEGPWFEQGVTGTPLTDDPLWLVASREKAAAHDQDRDRE